ncbi:MAG TPA: GntR family transcriptional regulator [Trebonia sp.]|jgi:DNA-binding GntR family transcriptional regulator|nr:GntR family transcriptional regulator [Trebonia sp.]
MEMLDEGILPDPRKYRKMADAIRAQIDRGVLAPGDPAPTISELSTTYACARQTAAKSLRTLVDEGLLIRYPGIGYYVAPRRRG